MTSQTKYIYRVVVVGPEEDGYEGEPDDAGGVHGEADVLGLVEVGGDLPGLDGVDGAEEDEDHVVHQGHDQGEGGHPARLHRTRVLTLGHTETIHYTGVHEIAK